MRVLRGTPSYVAAPAVGRCAHRQFLKLWSKRQASNSTCIGCGHLHWESEMHVRQGKQCETGLFARTTFPVLRTGCSAGMSQASFSSFQAVRDAKSKIWCRRGCLPQKDAKDLAWRILSVNLPCFLNHLMGLQAVEDASWDLWQMWSVGSLKTIPKLSLRLAQMLTSFDLLLAELECKMECKICWKCNLQLWAVHLLLTSVASTANLAGCEVH